MNKYNNDSLPKCETCSDCRKTIESIPQIVPKLGHDYMNNPFVYSSAFYEKYEKYECEGPFAPFSSSRVLPTFGCIFHSVYKENK